MACFGSHQVQQVEKEEEEANEHAVITAKLQKQSLAVQGTVFGNSKAKLCLKMLGKDSLPAGQRQAAGKANRVDAMKTVQKNSVSAQKDETARRGKFKDHGVPTQKLGDSGEDSANFSAEITKSTWRTGRRHGGAQATGQTAQGTLDYNPSSSN